MEVKSPSENKALPFGLLYQEPETVDRGYEIHPETWNYDPQSQVTDLFKMGGGGTRPNTYSQLTTTHLVITDSDDRSDDAGTD